MAQDHIKNIVKLFEHCRYREDIYKLFGDWCECAAIALSNAVDFSHRDKREAVYMEIVKRYEADTLKTFTEILGEVTLALEEQPRDVLGQVFHALELHNTARGQFFTPYHLCKLMAHVTIGSPDDLKAKIEARGFVTVQEPAIGAGAMVIALAEVLRENGLNYQRQMHVTGIDIDPRAVHMAYIQLSLLHIPAVVIQGDTLRMDLKAQWFTPAHIMGGWDRKIENFASMAARVLAKPAVPTPPEARIIPSKGMVPEQPAQMTLFFGEADTDA